MTLIEVVIAAMLLMISGLAVLTAVDAASRNGYRAQQSQVVVNRLQQELEQITQLPYQQLALTGAPATSSDQSDPNRRVSGTTFAIDRANTTPMPLAYNGGSVPQGGGAVSGGSVAPGGPGDQTAHFTSGSVGGTVYRYVVWDNSPSCPAPAAPCLKRVIVAAKLDSTGSGGARPYQELQSQDFDPGSKIPSSGDPHGENVPWTFWLTDTACNFATRQPILGDHPTHNTRSTCGTANSGPRTGSNAGPPDLMFTQPPPLDNSFPDDQQPLYDYATDVEPSSGPDTDKGLQLINGGNCSTIRTLWDGIPLLGNLLDGNNYLKVHKWLSPKVPSGFADIAFHESATLSLWTQTINDGVYNGGICVWMFTRHLNILNVPIDTPILTNPFGGLDYYSYQQDPWPHGGWSEISLQMNILAGVTLPVGYQLGLAVGIDQGNTGGGLEYAYDAPSYDSRLQIDTTGSLPF
jgi:type II secretory pathway pseudopilin PulG